MHPLKRYRMVKPLTEELAWQVLANHPRVPLPCAHCHMVFTYPAGTSFRDDDNALASAKELLDALVQGGLVAGDGPGQLSTSVEHRHGARAELVLEVWPVDGAIGRDDGETPDRRER
jgi:hypothetical protein